MKLGRYFFSVSLAAILAIACSSSAEDKKPAAPQPPNTMNQTPFPQPTGQPVAIDREAMMKDMATRSAIADLNRAVARRKREIYSENQEIRELQEKMRENQEKIDKILAADEELKKLKTKHESLISEMPAFSGPMNAPPPIVREKADEK